MVLASGLRPAMKPDPAYDCLGLRTESDHRRKRGDTRSSSGLHVGICKASLYQVPWSSSKHMIS